MVSSIPSGLTSPVDQRAGNFIITATEREVQFLGHCLIILNVYGSVEVRYLDVTCRFHMSIALGSILLNTGQLMA